MVKFPDLFHPTEVNYVLMFAKLFCFTLAVQLIINFRAQLRYFDTQPVRVYGRPIKLLGSVQLPQLNRNQFIIAGISLIVCLLFAASGLITRLWIGLAVPLYFLYFNPIISLAYVQRKTNLLPLVLLILLVSPSASQPLNSHSATAWELVLVKLAIVQLYFSAGWQKLKHSGLSWCSGESLQAYLLENYLWSDQKAGLLLARKQGLCAFLSILTLYFELTFWFILVFPQLTYAYVIAAFLFHLGTYATMRINYLKYLLPVYMVFFTDIAFTIKYKVGL